MCGTVSYPRHSERLRFPGLFFYPAKKEHFLQQITGQSRNIKQKQKHQRATRGCPEV